MDVMLYFYDQRNGKICSGTGRKCSSVLYRTRKPRPDSRRASVGNLPSLDRGHARRASVYERELAAIINKSGTYSVLDLITSFTTWFGYSRHYG